jgi:hypothetical protein
VTKPRHDDSIKPGRGIDGTEGENFSREHAVSPWHSNEKGDRVPDGTGKYTSNRPVLTNKQPYEANAETYSILDEVEAQSGDGGNRKVRSRGQP